MIEIGPGIGVITQEAANRAKKVIAVEIDKSLIPILEETLAEHDNIKIINEDILKLDLNKIIDEENAESVKIIGNLPYYITVSYTHLRAHETGRNLVCRLLLEKKKKQPYKKKK